MAPGFEQNGTALPQEPIHQRVDIVLQQRFAAGDLHERTAMTFDLGDHVVDRHAASFVEGVLGVAPRTPEIACGQPHEDAREPGARRFALDRIEDLVDGQHV